MGNLLLIESAGAPVFTERYKYIKDLGHTLIVARQDLMGSDEAENLVDFLIRVKPHNFENIKNVVETIIEFSRNVDIEGIMTRWDAGIPVMSHVSERLGFSNIPKETSEIVRCKNKLRQVLEENNLPSAKYALVTNLPDAIKNVGFIGFPVVIKPTLGYGSWGVVRINNLDELKKEFPKILELSKKEFNSENILIEEFLDGIEISIDSIIFGGDVIFSNITEKPSPMKGEKGFAEIDFVTPADIDISLEEEIKQINFNLVNVLGIKNSITHVEMKLTDEGPKILEVNTRIPGGRYVQLVELCTNVNLEKVGIELAFNKKPEFQVNGQSSYFGFRIITPPKGGILQRLEGIERAKSLPGVIDVAFNKKIGEKVFELPYEIQDYLGFIVVTGDSKENILRLLDFVEKQLTFLIV